MAYLQERLAHYLTCDPHLFIAKKRELRYGDDTKKDVWSICALAVDPWKKTFFLGEATYNAKPSPLLRKVKKFYGIESEVIKLLALEGLPNGWNARPWLFIRKAAISFVLQRLPVGCYPKITRIEDTARPWLYESFRRIGAEPGKPYADLDKRFQD
jgi:hypothetical protein